MAFKSDEHSVSIHARAKNYDYIQDVPRPVVYYYKLFEFEYINSIYKLIYRISWIVYNLQSIKIFVMAKCHELWRDYVRNYCIIERGNKIDEKE